MSDIPDRVIDPEDARLFRVNSSAILLKDFFEKFKNEIHFQDLKQVPEIVIEPGPLPVTLHGANLAQPVGAAHVYWEGDRLVADATIDYACDIRLDIQNGQKVFLESFFMLEDDHSKAVLHGLFFSYKKPLDDREQPVTILS